MKLSTCPTPHHFSFLLLAVITVCCLLLSAAEPNNAAASEAGGSAYADDLIYKGKPLKKAGPLYRSPLKERLFSPAVLSRPPGEGAFRYTLFSDFSAGSGMEGSWCRLKDAPWICYIDDGALAFRTRLKAPRTAGTHRYLWTFQAPGGAEAAVRWEYRILSAQYARLICVTNGGMSRSVYGGSPLAELDLSSGISFASLHQSLQDKVLEKQCAGLWKVTRSFEGRDAGSDLFELRMLAVRDASIAQATPQGKEPASIKFRACVEALPAKTSLSPSGWHPESLMYRICSLRARRDGELLVHKAWSPTVQILDTPSPTGTVAEIEHQWNGIDDGAAIPPPEGKGIIMLQVSGHAKEGYVKSQFGGAPFAYATMPRIVAKDRYGEILADSMELNPSSGIAPQPPGNHGASHLPASVTFIPRGDGVSLPPPSGPLSGDRLTSRIFSKSINRDEPVTVSIHGLPENWSECTLAASSSFPRREGLAIDLKREGRSLSREVEIILTSQKESRAPFLFIGRRSDSEKGFALIDLTYLEDTWMMKNILTGRGWHSAGEYYGSGAPQNPPLMPEFRAFIKNCGYETITFTCDALPDLQAVMHVKNQAQLLYYGGHGWANSAIYIDGHYIYPEQDIVEGDWSDGLKVVIFSSCSILDIGNFNRRSFTAFGKANQSPGIYWAKVAGPEVALLGYNWSTQEGKPPNAFDTRVIRRYINLSSQYSPPVAWLYANIQEGDSVAPCAIYRHNYYFINASSMTILAVPERNWRDASPPPDAVRIAWPR